jgi:hypothetical protein
MAERAGFEPAWAFPNLGLANRCDPWFCHLSVRPGGFEPPPTAFSGQPLYQFAYSRKPGAGEGIRTPKSPRSERGAFASLTTPAKNLVGEAGFEPATSRMGIRFYKPMRPTVSAAHPYPASDSNQNNIGFEPMMVANYIGRAKWYAGRDSNPHEAILKNADSAHWSTRANKNPGFWGPGFGEISLFKSLDHPHSGTLKLR